MTIQEVVGASESPFKEDIPVLCEYARLFGGGQNCRSLYRMLCFIRTCVADDQYIGISTIEAIINLRLKGNEHCPNVMTAILEAQAKCGKQFVKSHVCNYIKDSEIAALANRTEDLTFAESILVQVWKLALDIEEYIEKETFVQIMGWFDCLVARVLLVKNLPDDIDTFEHCAARAVDDLKQACPKIVIENP